MAGPKQLSKDLLVQIRRSTREGTKSLRENDRASLGIGGWPFRECTSQFGSWRAERNQGEGRSSQQEGQHVQVLNKGELACSRCGGGG